MSYSIDSASIDPAEAIRICRKSMDASTYYVTMRKLWYDIRTLIPYNHKIMGSHCIHMAEITAAIYMAGRIQGIREERAKRRKVHR